ncbi:transposase [Streptomyces sp. NPDC059718]
MTGTEASPRSRTPGDRDLRASRGSSTRRASTRSGAPRSSRAAGTAEADKGEAARRASAADDSLAHEITVPRVAFRHTYGVPRVHAELRLGQWANRKRVTRGRRERDIRGVTRHKRHSQARPDETAKQAPDLMRNGGNGEAMAGPHRTELIVGPSDMPHGRQTPEPGCVIQRSLQRIYVGPIPAPNK